jgi:hypothetical protein
MAEVSNQRTSPWIAFLAGAVVMLAIVLIAFAWWRGEQAAQGVTLAAPAPHAARCAAPARRAHPQAEVTVS